MRRIILIVIGLVFSSFLLNAHPPEDIKLELIPDSPGVIIKVEHKVQSPANHFIEKIEIRVGKKLLKKWNFNKQENIEFQSVEFNRAELRLLPGIKFTVVAVCNKVGRVKKEFVF